MILSDSDKMCLIGKNYDFLKMCDFFIKNIITIFIWNLLHLAQVGFNRFHTGLCKPRLFRFFLTSKLSYWVCLKFNVIYPLPEEELSREKAIMDETALGGKTYLRPNGKVQTFSLACFIYNNFLYVILTKIICLIYTLVASNFVEYCCTVANLHIMLAWDPCFFYMFLHVYRNSFIA